MVMTSNYVDLRRMHDMIRDTAGEAELGSARAKGVDAPGMIEMEAASRV